MIEYVFPRFSRLDSMLSRDYISPFLFWTQFRKLVVSRKLLFLWSLQIYINHRRSDVVPQWRLFFSQDLQDQELWSWIPAQKRKKKISSTNSSTLLLSFTKLTFHEWSMLPHCGRSFHMRSYSPWVFNNIFHLNYHCSIYTNLLISWCYAPPSTAPSNVFGFHPLSAA